MNKFYNFGIHKKPYLLFFNLFWSNLAAASFAKFFEIAVTKPFVIYLYNRVNTLSGPIWPSKSNHGLSTEKQNPFKLWFLRPGWFSHSKNFSSFLENCLSGHIRVIGWRWRFMEKESGNAFLLIRISRFSCNCFEVLRANVMMSRDHKKTRFSISVCTVVQYNTKTSSREPRVPEFIYICFVW